MLGARRHPSRPRPKAPARPLAAILLALSALLALLAAPAAATYPGRNGPIAVSVLEGERPNYNNEVYVLDPGGSQPRNLSNNPSWDGDPGFSPDGQWIAFASRHNRTDYETDIFLIRPDGSGLHQLTDGEPNQQNYGGGPAFSPDGSQIAFSKEWALSLMDADGSNEQRLINSGSADADPAFSPDGKWIAFHSTGGGAWHLGAIELRADGEPSPPIRLTPEKPTTDNGPPDFSPDGERIVFRRSLDYPYSGPAEVYTINPDGSDPRRLTYGWAPTFSPDGEKIAFMRYNSDTQAWELHDDEHRRHRAAQAGRLPRSAGDRYGHHLGPRLHPLPGPRGDDRRLAGDDVLRGTAGNDVIAGLERRRHDHPRRRRRRDLRRAGHRQRQLRRSQRARARRPHRGAR